MHRCERSLPLVQARSCSCPGNRRNIERPPIVETSVCKLSALTAGRRSMRHRLAMSQKPTTCGLDRCANEMNWCRAGRYLFARSRHGSTTSTRSPNSTPCPRIDLGRWAANWCGCLFLAHRDRGQGAEFTSAFGGTADVRLWTALAGHDANDPSRTFGNPFCCDAQQRSPTTYGNVRPQLKGGP